MKKQKNMHARDKKELYNTLAAQLRSLVEGETFYISNLANAAALLFNTLSDINWSGFYMMHQGELVLGPFQGKVACVRIPVGKGVCGTAVAENKTQLVPDVHKFPGHIACDSASNSEIVIPIRIDGEVIGVLDIDSPVFDRFGEDDRTGLESFVKVLESACDWNEVLLHRN